MGNQTKSVTITSVERIITAICQLNHKVNGVITYAKIALNISNATPYRLVINPTWLGSCSVIIAGKRTLMNVIAMPIKRVPINKAEYEITLV